ncbi:unnamed protein product [Owenia fusiformis]|uniref:Uncharacterized protein n=1 Tax=Owenia fusiformis TaxID=6347 RepID=A0A8J1XQD4_OWEFU|nr:unnamed protein product [Owenia fusiformis]
MMMLTVLFSVTIFAHSVTYAAKCNAVDEAKLCADIVLAFDTSCSVSDATKDGAKVFMDDFVSLFNSVGKPNLPANSTDFTFTQFGLLAYDLEARKIFGFGDQPSKDFVQGKIDEFDHTPVTCKTGIHRALKMAKEEFFDSGTQDDRTPNILILLTDGRTQPKKFIPQVNKTMNVLLELNNTYVFVVVLPNKFDKDDENDTLKQLNMLAPEGNRFSYLNAESNLSLAKEVRQRIGGFDPCPVCVSDEGQACIPETPLDILLIIDHSKSIKPDNLKVLQEAMIELVNAFEIVGDEAHGVKFSIITYNKKAEILLYFNSTEASSKEGTLGILKTMSLKQGKDTRTDLALQLANSKIFNAAFGDRLGAANIIILATDGKTMKKKFQKNTITAADELKSRGESVDIFLLGLPTRRKKNLDVQIREWDSIPSKPVKDHFKKFEFFTDIEPYISQLKSFICEDQKRFIASFDV